MSGAQTQSKRKREGSHHVARRGLNGMKDRVKASAGPQACSLGPEWLSAMPFLLVVMSTHQNLRLPLKMEVRVGGSIYPVSLAQVVMRGSLSPSGFLKLPLRQKYRASLRIAALPVGRWAKCSKYTKSKGQDPKGSHSLFLWTPCGMPVCRISAEDSPFC